MDYNVTWYIALFSVILSNLLVSIFNVFFTFLYYKRAQILSEELYDQELDRSNGTISINPEIDVLIFQLKFNNCFVLLFNIMLYLAASTISTFYGLQLAVVFNDYDIRLVIYIGIIIVGDIFINDFLLSFSIAMLSWCKGWYLIGSSIKQNESLSKLKTTISINHTKNWAIKLLLFFMNLRRV